MVKRKAYQVFNGSSIVATIDAYSAEGACEIVSLRLGIPVHMLTAKLVDPPKVSAIGKN
jgi:hypothetical protein